MNMQIKYRFWNTIGRFFEESDRIAVNKNGDLILYDYETGEWSVTKVENTCLTINQFSGLKDKNDKEIYEGDIIRFFDEDLGETEEEQTINVCEVKFGKGIFDGGYYKYIGFYLVNSGGKVCEPHEITCLVKCDGEFKFEVIGNIHETPELLK